MYDCLRWFARHLDPFLLSQICMSQLEGPSRRTSSPFTWTHTPLSLSLSVCLSICLSVSLHSPRYPQPPTPIKPPKTNPISPLLFSSSHLLLLLTLDPLKFSHLHFREEEPIASSHILRAPNPWHWKNYLRTFCSFPCCSFFFPLTNQPRKIPFRKGKEGAIHATLRRREIRRTEI